MNLFSQIENFIPETDQEAAARQELLELIHQYDHKILSRDCEAGHITCSGLVLSPDLKKTLMAYHLIYQSVGWLGGHADGEEDLSAVAFREVQEETSVSKLYFLTRKILSIDILPVPAHSKHGKPVPEHLHYNITYGLIAPETQEIADKPDENKNVRWITLAEIPELCTEPHMIPVYQKIIARMQNIARQKKLIPGLIKQPILDWYPEHHRDLPWRKDQNPYHVWVSEIMLQQTRVEAVKNYYQRFLKALPDIKALADCPEEKLLKLWEGLGYYNRVRNMQKAARTIMQDCQGIFPKTYDEIRNLSGIGDYTAGAVSSICFNLPVPAVDGNVLRVFARLEEDSRNILDQHVKQDFTDQLAEIYDYANAGMLTQAFMELGATVCIPNGMPKCEICPLQKFCMAYQNQSQNLLPVREKKQKRRTEYKTIFVLQYENKIAVRKRPPEGLLAGLWELPNTETFLSPEEAVQQAQDWNTHPQELIKIINKKHIFTHITWEMQGIFLKCRTQSPAFVWADSKELETLYSLPTAFRCLLN
ncbi:MAG: A/G-specific adenine glycosylase [Oscillospiraceae bacterium]|nr:A/G-specific adenine glycosylase [Oscillospiraceae bacterium]